MEYVLSFLAGFFLTNSVPHLVKGITGQSHMTPFKRVSTPLFNVVWSFTNIVIGLFILQYAALTLVDVTSLSVQSWLFLAGAFACAVTCAWLWTNPNARLPWHKD